MKQFLYALLFANIFPLTVMGADSHPIQHIHSATSLGEKAIDALCTYAIGQLHSRSAQSVQTELEIRLPKALFAQVKTRFLQRFGWRYTYQAQKQVFLLPYNEKVTAIALSADKLFVVIGTEEGTVYILETQTGTMHTLYKSPVKVCAIAMSNHYIAIGLDDGNLVVWNNATKKNLTYQHHVDPITAVTIASNEQFILSGSENQTLYILDITTGQCLNEILTDNAVVNITLSTDNTFAIVELFGGIINVYDCTDWTITQTFEGTHTALSPDNKLLALRPKYPHLNTVSIYNLKTGRLVCSLPEINQHEITAIAFSADNHVTTGNSDGLVVIWNCVSGRMIHHSRQTHNRGPICRVEKCIISRDNECIVAAMYNSSWHHTFKTNAIHIWRTAPFETVTNHMALECAGPNKETSLEKLACNAACTLVSREVLHKPVEDVVQGTKNRLPKVLYHMLETRFCSQFGWLHTPKPQHNTIFASRLVNLSCKCLLTSDGQTLFAMLYHNESTVIAFDSGSGSELYRFKHPEMIKTFTLSPDESLLITTSKNNAYVWNLQTGLLMHVLAGHPEFIQGDVAISSDSQFAATRDDATIHLWSLKDGICFRTLTLPPCWSGNVHIVDNDLIIAECYEKTAHAGKAICIWEVGSDRNEPDYRIAGRITALSHGNRFAVTQEYEPEYDPVTFDRIERNGDRIYIWDIVKKSLVQTFITEENPHIIDAVISSDAQHLVTVTSCKVVSCWDVRSGTQSYSLSIGSLFESVFFSADNQLIVTSEREGNHRAHWQTQIWHAASGNLLNILQDSHRPRFSRDKQHLFSLAGSPYDSRQWLCRRERGSFDTILQQMKDAFSMHQRP